MAEWQPIETAPKDGRFFLAAGACYGESGRGIYFDVVAWRAEENAFCAETDGPLYAESGWEERAFLTHWQPLPDPPK